MLGQMQKSFTEYYNEGCNEKKNNRKDKEINSKNPRSACDFGSQISLCKSWNKKAAGSYLSKKEGCRQLNKKY